MSGLAKKLILTISVLSSIFIVCSVIYYRSFAFLPFMIGVILGAAVSITKVFLLERTVDKALEMEQKNAKNYVGVHHILRLLFTGAVLILAAVVPQISLWGAAAGVLSFQLAIYGVKLTSRR